QRPFGQTFQVHRIQFHVRSRHSQASQVPCVRVHLASHNKPRSSGAEVGMSKASSEKTAFVFAGGGSLGAVEVGMLKALVAGGVEADLAVGSSVGAINAAFFAADPSAEGVERL